MTITGLKFHDTFSAAFQVGFDYMIDRHWGFNVDVKKLPLRPDLDAAANNGTIPQTGTAKLDPWLKGAGLTHSPDPPSGQRGLSAPRGAHVFSFVPRDPTVARGARLANRRMGQCPLTTLFKAPDPAPS